MGIGEGKISSAEFLDVLRKKDPSESLPLVLNLFTRTEFIRARRDLRGEDAAVALNLLSENLGKIAPYYAPFILLSHLVGRVARRASDPDDILYKYSASRILRCLAEAVKAYISEMEESIRRYCASIDTSRVLVHAYGKLTAKCVEGLADKNPNITVLLFGSRARDYGQALARNKIIGAGSILIVPLYYSYQIIRVVDKIILQSDTITPEAILTRPGVAPVLLDYSPRIPEDRPQVLGLTTSFCFLPVRAKGILTYEKLASFTYKQPWHDDLQLPLFEIVPLNHIKRPIVFVDEKSEVEPKPIVFRRKTAKTLNSLLELVDARCRLYEAEN